MDFKYQFWMEKINKTAKKKNKRNEYKMNFYVENYSFVW